MARGQNEDGWRLWMIAVVVVCGVLALDIAQAKNLTCYCNIDETCIKNNSSCVVTHPGYPHPNDGYFQGGCIAHHTLFLKSKLPSRMEYGCFGTLSDLCKNTSLTTQKCCSVAEGDYCNKGIVFAAPAGFPTTAPVTLNTTVTPTVAVKEIHHYERLFEVVLPMGFLVILCLLAVLFYVKRGRGGTGCRCGNDDEDGGHRRKNSERRILTTGGHHHHGDGGGSSSLYDESMSGSEYVVPRMVARPRGFVPHPQQGGDSMSASMYTSGSGHSCTVYLVHRTLAREIELQECIGKGRYGEVHCGVWHGEDVGVKIFYARDESSWLQETQIYNSVLLKHENILSYYGSDMLSKDDRTELWLITQFHPHGSLYDYLLHHELDVETTLNFVYSMASGLNHLHMEIRGTAGKRSIAHRDLKAKNILVKNDLTCCIADLGLAVMHDPECSTPPDIPTHKVGTKRYMSPEMLTEAMNVFQFHAFRCADMYSLGLVLWETVRRCRVNGFVFDYNIPYFDRLPNDPDFHEVRALIVDQHYRPPLPQHVRTEPDLAPIVRLMADCWRLNPEARVTALRVKKTLYDIRRLRSRANGTAVAAHQLAPVREEAPLQQPHSVALPAVVAAPVMSSSSTTSAPMTSPRGGSSVDSQLYSALGPETDVIDTDDADDLPIERSEAIYLPESSVVSGLERTPRHQLPIATDDGEMLVTSTAVVWSSAPPFRRQRLGEGDVIGVRTQPQLQSPPAGDASAPELLVVDQDPGKLAKSTVVISDVPEIADAPKRSARRVEESGSTAVPACTAVSGACSGTGRAPQVLSLEQSVSGMSSVVRVETSC